jgi:site-specific DNA-methyltransferase (adenine-specific)
MSVAQNKILYDLGDKKLKHPAVFPYDIPYKHIQTWTNEGDLVLDPFMGSGTTALAAMDLKRNYIGIDFNEDYCKIADIRIKANGKKEL